MRIFLKLKVNPIIKKGESAASFKKSLCGLAEQD